MRDFSKVHLVRPNIDSHESLQAALDRRLDLVFSPGIYRLGQTLTVAWQGVVLLGLGLAAIRMNLYRSHRDQVL